MIKRNCMVCNAPIIGRSDKKYCSDQCHATQNNAATNAGEKVLGDVNKVLRKNRTILKRLCPTGKAVVPRQAMSAMDFDFQYFTSILITLDKKIYYICYDFAFTPIPDGAAGKALIVAWKENRSGFDPWKYVNPSLNWKNPDAH
jgi:hypothetical protein